MKISLKAHRVNSGLSVKEVAERMGVSEKTIRRWENDVDCFRKATIDKLIELAELYNVEINDLMP